MREFDVIIERDAEGFYVASVPSLAGCHTQARSLDELMDRVREAVELCLESRTGRKRGSSSSASSGCGWQDDPPAEGDRPGRRSSPRGRRLHGRPDSRQPQVPGAPRWAQDGRAGAGETIGPGLMGKILRDCEMDRERLLTLL